MSEPTFNYYPNAEDVLDVLEELTHGELEHLEESYAYGFSFWTDSYCR